MLCGELLKKRREELKLSREALSRKSGLSVMSIRRYESDEREPRLETVKRLADALDCTIFDLVDDWKQLALEDQADAVLDGGIRAETMANFDRLTYEGKVKVRDYTSDMLKLYGDKGEV